MSGLGITISFEDDGKENGTTILEQFPFSFPLSLYTLLYHMLLYYIILHCIVLNYNRVSGRVSGLRFKVEGI